MKSEAIIEVVSAFKLAHTIANKHGLKCSSCFIHGFDCQDLSTASQLYGGEIEPYETTRIDFWVLDTGNSPNEITLFCESEI